MEKQICVYSPTLLPIIEQSGTRYVVDLEMGHFRQLTSPYEGLSFESERGQELATAAGVRTCRRCETSFIAPGTGIGIRCVNCGELTEPALSNACMVELRGEDEQEQVRRRRRWRARDSIRVDDRPDMKRNAMGGDGNEALQCV